MIYPTFKVVFDRKRVATASKKGLVQIEISHNGKRKWIGTGVKVFARQFKKESVCGRADALELNEQIQILVSNVRSWANEMYKNGEEFSFEKLDRIINQVKNPDSFILFIEQRIENRKIKSSTKGQHLVMLDALKEFGIIQYFSDLNLKNIKLWDDYIKQRVTAQSSVYSYHKRLKVYVNEAFQLDLIKKNPYEGFQTPRGNPSANRKYLESSELEKIESVELHEPPVNNARDCFVFCCFSGLAYADLVKFNWKNDVVEIEGKFYIDDVRLKTGSRYRIQILSPAMDMLKKHGFSLPIMSNQKYNMYLKVVASYAKIKKNLTSHVARHTFATWALSMGVGIETISRMLAHADIKTTQIYAKVLQKDVSDAFEFLESTIKK